MTIENNIQKIREMVFKERRISDEFNYVNNQIKNADSRERKMLNSQLQNLKASLKKNNDELLLLLEAISIQKPLTEEETIFQYEAPRIKPQKSAEKISEMEREILKRLKKKKEKVIRKKEKKPSKYIKFANRLFGERVKLIVKGKKLATLEKDLVKSNLEYTSTSYISVLILTTIIATIVGFVLFLFFLFFSITPEFPIITMAAEGFGERFIKVIWLLFFAPLATFLFMYLYPSMEKKSLEGKINQELPFATIHMAAIAGSRIEPINVFSIISSTKEYPHLEKEFNKLLNEINVYGYDLVTALKNLALNCPSSKLAELFNGLATTITSGGDLFDFFDKRSQSLLFEYRLDKEKRTKTAETFMDIYISVVIAAPMILMLLLMMMKISGLGVSLSTSTITFLVVGGVSLINVFFLIFLQLKQPANI